MRRIYITGASGFLGRYLLNFAPKTVQILAQYWTHPITSGNGLVQVVQQNLIEDSLEAVRKFEPEVIIHAAAQSSIDACQLHPQEAWAINYQATRRLIELARDLGSRFLFISSDVVFDGKKGNYREEDPPAPINIYAETKVACENEVLDRLSNAVVVRPSLFYGRSLNGRPNFTEVMYKNLKAGKNVYLYTDQFRTPILINNLASALWELAELDYTGILHMGGSQRISRYEMGKVMCQLFHLSEQLIIPIPSAKGNPAAPRPLDCSLNIQRAASLLKTRFVDVRTGLHLAFW